MAIPTVEVLVVAHDQDGSPSPRAQVTAKLSTVERYNGYVVPDEYSGLTNENGECRINLFPNELGTEGSEYKFKIVHTNGKTVTVYASIPNSNCSLHQVAELDRFELRGAGLLVTEEVSGYANQAIMARDNARAAESAAANYAILCAEHKNDAQAAATTATTRAAKSSASATASANSATTSANSATASKTSRVAAVAARTGSEAARDLAQTYRNEAQAARDKAQQWADQSTNVAVETGRFSARHHATKASGSATAAATSRDNAATSATQAASSASAAATSATQAANSATTAAGRVTTARGHANAASVSAGSASNSAATATTRRDEAAVSASRAASSASAAANSATQAANSATTAAGHVTTAQSHAKAASVSAGNASNSAATATTRRDEAAVSASQALNYRNQCETFYNDMVAEGLHSHNNKAILDATTASFTVAEKEKLDLGWLDTAVANELRMLAVGINPSLDLNFAKQEYKHYDGAEGLVSHPMTPFVDFARTTTASYFGADGLLKTAAINEPRIEYDPTTGECKGLLIEESRTNLVRWSEKFDNAAWSNVRSSIVANTVVAPDGALTGDKLVASLDNAEHYTEQYISNVSPGEWYNISICVRQAEIKSVRIRVYSSPNTGSSAVVDFRDMTTVSTTVLGSAEIGDTSITAIGGGWYRLSMAFKFNTLDTARLIRILTLNNVYSASYTGDGTSGLYIWGAQLEVGRFPSSYIKTEASAVTRGADNASVTGANFSSWYRQDEYSVLSRSAFLSATALDTVWSIDNGLISNRARVLGWSNGPSRFTASSGGKFQAGIISQTTRPNSVAVGVQVNNMAAAFDGHAVQQVSIAAMPAVAPHTLHLGSSNGEAPLNGHISRLTYWPKRLTNAQLQELSK